MEKVRLGIVGLGGRGKYLSAMLLDMEGCEICSVCDVYADRVEELQKTVKDKKGTDVFGTVDYKEQIAHGGIDALVICTAWESHIEISTAAMRAGLPVGMEVGGAYTVEDCFTLVRTQVETGTKFMFLENCCYGRAELAVWNMVKQGLFGEVVHCAGGYQHDLRPQVLTGEEKRHYRLRNYIERNCDNYPMHALGPIAKMLGINEGNRMLYLTSMASRAAGLNDYATLHPERFQEKYQNQIFNQGDVIRTEIMCENGTTISLTLNTTCSHPYSRHYTVQGTRARYCEEGQYFFMDIDHDAKMGDKPETYLGNQKEYLEKYDHPIWQKFLHDGVRGGHGGMDWLLFEDFFDYILHGGKSPIDVYDAAAWMCITPLSAQSIREGSRPVEIPDFTKIK
ncbi:MAG: Gfo/Idh/MocA family oxidoreductase [Clostridia bacterium]|nr:Gfo/Idh/MocA family oxidoreductase [Clostridia bacterium]